MRRMKRKWGHWHLRLETLELVYRNDSGFAEYVLDLEDCYDCASTMDWVAQVEDKEWTSEADVGALVSALNDLIGLQENLCGGSVDHRIDPAKVIRARIGR